jgi:hypothetical protein
MAHTLVRYIMAIKLRVSPGRTQWYGPIGPGPGMPGFALAGAALRTRLSTITTATTTNTRFMILLSFTLLLID